MPPSFVLIAALLYSNNTKGLKFDVWCGCYTSSSDHTALLACVAINGYHATASYRWELCNITVSTHDTPLLYCTQTGVYICQVTCDDESISCNFEVKGKINFKYCYCSFELFIHMQRQKVVWLPAY